MICLMDMEHSSKMMETNIRDITERDKSMVLGNTCMQMEQFMKAPCSTTKDVGMELLNMQTVMFTKDIGSMAEDITKVKRNVLMELIILGTTIWENLKASVFSNSKIVQFSRVLFLNSKNMGLGIN